MTASRRFSLPAPALLLASLLAGCANSDQFTAGRLPYGGRSAQVAAQDPFAPTAGSDRLAQGAAAVRQTASPGTHPVIAETVWNGGQPPAGNVAAASMLGPPTSTGATVAAAHQTAYFEVASDNPFAEVAPTPASYGPAGSVQQMAFEMPTPPAGANPFAEVQGRPAAAPRTTSRPAEPALEQWQPRERAAPPDDVFLPPAR